MWTILIWSLSSISQPGLAAGFYVEPCSSFNEKISESLTLLTDCLDRILSDASLKIPNVYCEREKQAYFSSLSEAEKCKLANKILPSKTK